MNTIINNNNNNNLLSKIITFIGIINKPGI